MPAAPLDPIGEFEAVFARAALAAPFDPTATALATADASGRPSARMVLFKGVDERGFRFFTNYDSRKGRELEAVPHAALAFWWPALERQVRVEGGVQRLPRAASEAYFATRPYGSQIGALASRQSQPLDDRAALERAAAELRERHPPGQVPCPPRWGGYVLAPDRFEFWQGRDDRLHDRLAVERAEDGWHVTRLAP